MREGYSREAFDQNEQKIDDARLLADMKPFGLRADPADIMIARMEYLSGKQERERLTGLAYEEAVAEDKKRSQESSASFRIADFSRVVLKTESGNSYIIQRNPSGPGHLVVNINGGTIEQIYRGANFK